jgi:Tfp pilus assembly protein PilX
MRTLVQSRANSEGVALPVSLIIVGVILIVAVSLFRASRSDLLGGANEADRVLATQASDAALRLLLNEIRALPVIPEVADPSGSTLSWWNTNPTAITANFWSTCAAAPAPNRCAEETITRAGRTYRVQRTVQPTGAPDESTGTSGALAHYYRAAVLVTLDNGARSEVESYIRRPQIGRR